jgi:hypothetical protein
LGPIISRLFTCSNMEKNKLKKTKGACSSPISMVTTKQFFCKPFQKKDKKVLKLF